MKKSADSSTSKKIILGKITGVYGVKGWVKVFSYAKPKESIVDYNPWYLRPEKRTKTPWEKIILKAGKGHAKTVVAKLEHCNDRDQALAYIGYEIAIEAHQLAPLNEKTQFYWRDLIGLAVHNQQGFNLGCVKNLFETGANDVLVVVLADSKEECLIPWIWQQVIVNVDLTKGIIQVDWDVDWDTN